MAQVLKIVGEMGVVTTADLNTSLIARFIAGRPATESPNTTIGLVSALRAACNFAAVEGYVRVSPFLFRRRWVRRVTPKPPQFHTLEQMARVLDLARREIGEASRWDQWKARRLYALVTTVAFTGMRKNES